MNNDSAWMRRALTLARRGVGRTAPNPTVGAVVVKRGKVVGEGFHRGPGTPHAEVHALAAAGSAARGATLYVTLEPCSHTGKRTPPCAPEVIRSGVTRVVVGMVDPNPKVAGRGIKAIAAAGVEVAVGVEEGACRALNAPYVRVMETGLPWVTLKIAQTLDGKVATASGESRWITGEAARRHGHRLRDRHDAIMVGIGTVLADDPQLTCRIRGGRDPLRVVVDANLATPPAARVLTRGAQPPTILACVADASVGQGKALAKAGADVLRLPARKGRVDLMALLTELAARGMHSVLCEGGPTLAAELLRLGLVNRVACYVAPALMGGDDARGGVAGRSPAALADMVALGPFAVRRLGDDILLEADVREPAPPQAVER